jgi:hypothetical protein
MNEETHSAEDLQARFASPPPGIAAADHCPDPDRIWLAARNELPWSEVPRLLDHTATCPACTVAWRMAREHWRTESPSAASAERRLARRDWSWLRYGAAAAVLFAGIGIALHEWSPGTPERPGLRVTARSAIHSLVPDGGVLPRSDAVLRWTPGPLGTRYSIQVTDERLVTLAEASALDGPEFRVPEASLSGLGAGATILWQVKAVFPDGTRLTSDTFAVRVLRSP